MLILIHTVSDLLPLHLSRKELARVEVTHKMVIFSSVLLFPLQCNVMDSLSAWAASLSLWSSTIIFNKHFTVNQVS